MAKHRIRSPLPDRPRGFSMNHRVAFIVGMPSTLFTLMFAIPGVITETRAQRSTVNYRNEIPYAYEQSKPPQNLPDSISGERRMLKSGPTLDHEDLIAIIRYLQTLPYVDKNAVGAMGVSHSGEMIMKASSEYTFGAGVCIEPANHEFLTVDTGPNAPRKGTEIQYNDIEVARKNANKTEGMERI